MLLLSSQQTPRFSHSHTRLTVLARVAKEAKPRAAHELLYVETSAIEMDGCAIQVAKPHRDIAIRYNHRHSNY